ncbi:efflux RND transporter permease subunit [bacterium]|nr:efflux RND transporter permease subunit [bacterium]
MNIPRFAIENRQFTIIFICILLFSGIASFITMPKSEDPMVQPPGTTVIVVYPGANSFDLEQLVLEPLESAINELEDINHLESYAFDGLAYINVEFESKTDANEKYDEVSQKVNGVRSELPDDLSHLEIIAWTISDVHILQLALCSESASYRELEKKAETIKREMEKVPGVMKVGLWAIPEQQVQVFLDLPKLGVLKIPLNQVLGAIQEANANIPGGYVELGSKRFNVETSGPYRSLEEIENTVIQAGGAKIVQLKEVAKVSMGYESDPYHARLNGQRCVFITAAQKPGSNIFKIFRGLRPVIGRFEKNLPSSMALQVVFDQSQSVSYRIQGFFWNLIQGIILVGVVIFLAVGVRASSVVMTAIPTSILIAIGFVDLTGYGLQQVSIAGLVIALGLLVDNAIVVTENSTRFMRLGSGPKEAVIAGTSEVAWALASATATTVFAFIPIILISDKTGDFIRSLPVTVVYTLSASLLISLVLTPFLTQKYVRVTGATRETWFRKKLNIFIEKRYRQVLGYSLDHPWRTILIALFLFLTSLGLSPLVGVSFFPKAEKPQFFVNIDLPQGSSMAQTDSLAREIEADLLARPEIKTVAANIGHGNPRLYYNIMTSRKKSSHAQLFVELNTRDKGVYERLVVSLRDTYRALPGARIRVRELEQGPPIIAPIHVRLLGDDYAVLKRISTEIEGIVAGQEGTINVQNPLSSGRTDLKININREKAGMLGVPLSEIDRTVRLSLVGLPITEFRDRNGKSYPLIVKSSPDSALNIENLKRVYVTSLAGRLIPISQLATIEFSESPLEISHYFSERNVAITADVARGFSTDLLTRNIIRELDEYPWPDGYRYSMGGEMEERIASFGGLFKAIIIAIIAIFAILVLQFRSFRQPLIVFMAVPLALIGSILALLVTGNSFSFMAFVGLTSLVGIVVNNSIILVDYTNQLRRTGMNIEAALKSAGETRFTPILLTTATTIGGLLPLTLQGGSIWAPMGWAIIGGLTTSTLLTLIVVPVLYRLLER